MSLIADHGFAFLVLACLFGFFMAWGVGANDVANAMGTSVGSRALTIRQAILVAMVFEFCGAYFAGGEVTETIRSGIVAPQYMTPDLLVFGMLSALLAAGVWLLLATIKGWPVSTTHSIVGAIIGFASVGVSVHAVHWGAIGPIVASWVVTPVLSGLLAFALFRSVQWLVLHAEDPFRSARRYVPLYMFLAGFMVALMTVGKGLKHVGLELSGLQTLGLALLAGGLVMGLGIVLLLRIRPTGGADPRGGFASVERVFAVLMIFTACSMAFAHGANDVANAIGPVAAVVAVVQAGGDLDLVSRSPVPSWVLLLGAVGIVIGLATYGYRVIATIGREITELTPSRGFARRAGDRLHGGWRLGHRPAGIHHPYPGRRGARHRHGARHRRAQPAGDRLDLPVLGSDPAGRRGAGDPVLPGPARAVRRLSAIFVGWRRRNRNGRFYPLPR